MPSTTYAVRTDGLAKRFGDEVAVRDLDLAIERGTVFGFLGPNGAGKTTTMRMLTTLTRPTSGSAFVFDRPVTDRAAVRDRIGYLPEEPPVFDELTVAEQLRYAARLRDLPADAADERIDEWLDRFDLAGDAGKRLEDCSKGMRQKVGLIQALLHEPDVVFLDEPTSGLDPRAARTVRDAIAQHAAAGTTVFLSTHILPVVEELADVVGVLHDGRLVAEASPAELTERAEQGESSTLEDAFLAVTTDDAAPAASESDDATRGAGDSGDAPADEAGDEIATDVDGSAPEEASDAVDGASTGDTDGEAERRADGSTERPPDGR